MKTIIEIIQRNNSYGYCFRKDHDGGIEKVKGMSILDTKLFGITIIRRIKWSFVSEIRLFGMLIFRSHIQGWEGVSSKHP